MYYDFHLHSNFSEDSTSPMEDMIKEGIKQNLKGMCFTEHTDLDFPGNNFTFLADLDAYEKTFLQLKEKYRSQIKLYFGLEVGLQPHLKEEIPALCASRNFDFLIGSTHVADCLDPYDNAFFENRTETQAYQRYFEVLLKNLQTYSCFDTCGHIDYVVRYGPSKNVHYCYKNHADAKIIVNTTPVGMYPNSDDCPIDLDRFTALEGVADVVYNPLRTQLVLEAEKRGIRAAGGLEMLVAQAKYAVEIFLDTHLEDARIAEINTPLLKERSNLVLVGMSGGGKSTIGKRAAEKLGKGFVDTDDLIIERIKMPIAEFFAKEGEPAFREIETKVIHEVSSRNNLVIATGGGIIKNPLNVEYLKRNGRLIWLKRDADLLQTGNGRPLAPDQAAAQKLYQERLPLYTAAAEAIAENNGTFEEGLSAVLQCYESLLK